MKFIVNECTGPAVARWLEAQGYNVLSVYDDARGISDKEVIDRAYHAKRILITNNKDFGEKVFREQYPHWGMKLLRLHDERAQNKIAVLERLLLHYKSITGTFCCCNGTAYSLCHKSIEHSCDTLLSRPFKGYGINRLYGIHTSLQFSQ